MGDSTAVGTGARDNRQSIAGCFSRDFPAAHIDNISRNGKKIGELRRELAMLSYPHYDLLVIQIGANDILRFTSYKDIEKDLVFIIDRAKMMADMVVILHSGNVGLSPIFSWPFNQIFTVRSRAVRSIYLSQARKKGIFYVDLFKERDQDPFEKDRERYYAPDHLHPSGDGYRYWYERIRDTLRQAGVVLSYF